jgi:hypothetical protein
MSARSKNPTKKGPPPPEHDDLPTEVYDSGKFKKEASTPIKAISMKTPAAGSAPPKEPEPPVLPHVKLRALSEVTKAQHSPQNLGNLAPPYDPAAARARSVREYIVWGSLAVILASGIALVVWFAAR